MNRIVLLMLIGLGVLSGCKKGPGEGGSATIRGKVYVKNYNGSYTVLKAEYYGGDESVYIVYGGDRNAYDDVYKTSYDGTYEFRHLRKGTYKIFVYSEKMQQEAVGDSAVVTTVQVKKDGEIVEVPDLVIVK
jgi:hypothetical protein